MMSDYSRTQELVSAAYDSTGASQEQFEKTLDSLQAKLTNLRNAWDQFAMGLANNEIIKGAVDVLTTLLNTLNSIIDTISGGNGFIKSLASLGIAFAGFKLGRNFLGQSGIGSKLRMALGKGTEKDVKAAGNTMAQNLGSGISEGIGKIKTKGGLGNVLLEKIGITKVAKDFSKKDLAKSFGLDQLDFSNVDFGKNAGNQIKLSLLNNFKTLPDELKNGMSTLDFGKILMNSQSLKELKNAIPPELYKKLRVTGEAAQNAGAQFTKMSGNMQTAATASMAAGLAFQGIASILESIGADDNVIEFFRTFGGILMTFSPIMSVVSSIFMENGKKIAASGWIAQSGWIWITVIIAAVAALTAGVVALSKSARENSLVGQMEAAQKATAAAKESAESAKTAYDDLLESHSEYSELQKTLDGLTKGTNEWKQALLDANAQVLELLTTYPKLASYISRGEDGQLIIDDAGFDTIIKEQEAAMQRAQAAAVASQMNETRIQQKIDEREIQEQFKVDVYFSQSDRKFHDAKGNSYVTGAEKEGYKTQLGSGSDRSFLYDEGLMNDLSDMIESGDLSDDAFDELANEYKFVDESAEDAAIRLRRLCDALAEYNSALATNQVQLESQAAVMLTAGADQEILDSRYNKSVISDFAKRMATDDYANKEKELADKYVKVGTTKEDKARKEKLASYGIESTGDEKKDTQLLYAQLSGNSVDSIPDDLKDDVEAMGREIGRLLASEEQIGLMEDFQKRLNSVDADTARNIAGLMSGDASLFTKSQLDQAGSLSDYYDELGFASLEEMANARGFKGKESTVLSQLSAEDQQAYARTQVKKFNGESEKSYQNRINSFITKESNIQVTAEVEMLIDQGKLQAQMDDAYANASANLSRKGVSEEGYKDFSIETVDKLSKQTANMSDEAAQKYVDNFNKVLSSSNLGESGKKQLENYLSTVDWSNMTEAVQAMDYMQSQGIDTSIIQEYWDIATDGVNTYVSTLSEALSLTDRMMKKMSSVADIASRLEEGKATYEDMMNLIAAGADISDFQLTPEGWKATAEQTSIATDKLKEYNAEQARQTADQQKQEFIEAATNAKDFIGFNEETGGYEILGDKGLGAITKVEDGKLVGGTVNADNKASIATALGIKQGEKETEEEFLTRLQTAYDNYISLLNNGEDIQIILDKQAAMAEAVKYTAAENEARLASGGITDTEAESIIYSARNEATEAGLDANEMMQYADTLRQVNTQLNEVTAAQVALANSKMNAGLGEIIDSYDEWSAVIDKDTGKLKDTSSTGVATYNKLKASVNKMLNTSEDLSDAFWDNADNMKNIEKAAKGDTKALGELQKAAAKDYIMSIAAETDDEKIIGELTKFSDFIVGYELPELNAGDILDDQDFINKCNEMIRASGMTAEQISNAFKSMGYDVEIDEAYGEYKRPVTTTHTVTTGNFPYDYTTREEVDTDYVTEKGWYPVVKTLTSTGSGGGGISTENISTGGGKGGGGGGSKKESNENWKNPYDEYYNTTEKINELLRQRNKLEQEFERLTKRNATTTAQLNKNLQTQLKNLESQVESQKQLITGKRKQLTNATKATMEVEEGRIISFQESYKEAGGLGDITQFGRYDESLGQVVIDWKKIERLQRFDAKQGETVEAYIGYLESISGELEEAQDALSEIEDNIIAIIDAQLEGRVELITTLKDAMVEHYQRQIDKLSELNDTINDSNSNILNGIQESIDLSRQIRDNTKTEEDIADKEARLAYLRRDTSGANDLEIKQLEEELSDARESYSDTLIDQELDRLNKQNDEAAEARQRQIDLMQAQLDYWQSSDYFNNIIEAMNEAEALALWKEIQDFNDKTEAEKISLMREWNELWNKGNTNSAELAAADSAYKGDKYTLTDSKGKTYSNMTYNASNDTWTNGKDSVAGSDISSANITNNTITTSKDLSVKPAPTPVIEEDDEWSKYPYGKASDTSGVIKKGSRGTAVRAIQYALNQLGFGNSGTKSVDGVYGTNTIKAVKAFQRAMGVKADGIVGDKTRAKFRAKQYLTGGLADYTGPAWLDGTRSKPELVLNAQDTQNFIALKDILSDIRKADNIQTKNSGDNYYDFHITVEQIANDYDVERMIEKVKDEIHKDSVYRNVNSIHLMR